MKNARSTIKLLAQATRALLLMATLVMNARAELLTYQLVFSGGSPTPTSGSFTYDTSAEVFTSFSVVWNATNINILPSANNPVTQYHQIGQLFSCQALYEALVNGGNYNELELSNTWAVYPPNPPGNVFVSQFALRLLNINNEGVLAGGAYPDPTFIATYTSGTFTVVPAPQDSDGDGVPDGLDSCPGTLAGEIVNAQGCSISQLVPPSGSWKSHGEYLSAVSFVADQFLAQHLITQQQKDAVISAAARSDVGKRL